MLRCMHVDVILQHSCMLHAAQLALGHASTCVRVCLVLQGHILWASGLVACIS
jgi:hypothetical protein